MFTLVLAKTDVKKSSQLCRGTVWKHQRCLPTTSTGRSGEARIFMFLHHPSLALDVWLWLWTFGVLLWHWTFGFGVGHLYFGVGDGRELRWRWRWTFGFGVGRLDFIVFV